MRTRVSVNQGVESRLHGMTEHTTLQSPPVGNVRDRPQEQNCGPAHLPDLHCCLLEELWG